MTSCAMTAGMVPMALGWSEGSEQTAPLARAVIGGLVAATIATLTVLPTVFALVQGWAGRESASLDPDDPASTHYPRRGSRGERDGPPIGQRRAAGSPASSSGGRPVGRRPLPKRLELQLRNVMPRANLQLSITVATGIVVLALATGCERASEGKAGPAAEINRSVEIVHAERHTIRRSVGEPGELEAFETTAIHAKIAGYVKNWTVNIGASVKKGQILVELSVPELDAQLKQKQAAIEQSVAKHKQAGAAVRVAETNVAAARAKLVEVRAGKRRVEADLARWQAEYGRVEELHAAKAQTGSLVDETRSKLRSSEAACEEVTAQIETAQVAVTQSQAALDSARSDVVAAASTIDVARADARTAEAFLAYTKIEAPFDGIVTQRNVNTGDLTRAGADAARCSSSPGPTS